MDGEVDLVYCSTTENVVDIFTKALGRDLLERHLHRLGVGPKKVVHFKVDIERGC